MIKRLNNTESELRMREFEVITPETMQGINTGSIQTAHITEYGACMHDFISLPCTKYRDCINCNEQVCIKGDDEKLNRLQKRLELEMGFLKSDTTAVESGLLNADQHYKRRLIIIQRCQELITLLSDETLNTPLLKYANAFQGKIVSNEEGVLNILPNAQCVHADGSHKNIGSCGTNASCSDHAPIACYLCPKFRPWQDAPHIVILNQLLYERDHIHKETEDLAIASINDRAIIAVTQVINQCYELNHHKESING